MVKLSNHECIKSYQIELLKKTMEVIQYKDLEDLSKKEIELRALDVINVYLNSGEEDTLDMLTKIVKLKDFIAVAEKALRGDIEGNFEENYGKSYTQGGAKFSHNQGRKILNYKVDDEYERLNKSLKEREELLKTAAASTKSIYDSEGVEVPRVPVTYSKSSITITY